MISKDLLHKKAALVRKWSLISTSEAGSGHPTSCLSAADLMTVLFDKYYNYDLKNPQNPNNDRLIFSKGHAAPLLYVLYAIAGAFPLEKLKTLRQITSDLEGHPTSNFKYAEAATGSLGQGLSIGAGMALAGKKDKLHYKTYVLLGDGELAEGSVWEAASFASYYKLDNLIAIADINKFGQSQETMYGHNIQEYVNRFSSFDWEVLAIDGHNFEEIEKALSLAVKNNSGKPFVIIAQTKKGKGVSLLEDKDGWHGKAVKKEELDKALKELEGADDRLKFKLHARGPAKSIPPAHSVNSGQASAQSAVYTERSRSVGSPSSFVTPRLSFSYKKGEEAATREVYGEILAQLGERNPFIYALDGDVKNSTYSEKFKKAHPDRFIECFIAEQNMVGVALGMAKRGKITFASTFAAFFTRAFDQIRMGVLSKANAKFVGSHAGVSIGEDGASQMGLEDIALFGSLPQTVVLHPADAVSTARLIPHMVDHNGISYLRTLRPKTPVLYDSKEKFAIGGSKILRSAQNDILTIVACGITVFEALKAYEVLKQKNIHVRVVDCYSVKPIDEKTLKKVVKETKKNIVVTVEDHFEHGGLGDFVMSAISDTGARVEKMAVKDVMHSGTKDELLDLAGISAKHIVKKVQSLLKK